MGDDAEPRELRLLPRTDVGELGAILASTGAGASIAGGRATWELQAGGRPLAVLAQQWPGARYLVHPRTRLDDLDGELHLRYLAQVDPDEHAERLAPGCPPMSVRPVRRGQPGAWARTPL